MKRIVRTEDDLKRGATRRGLAVPQSSKPNSSGGVGQQKPEVTGVAPASAASVSAPSDESTAKALKTLNDATQTTLQQITKQNERVAQVLEMRLAEASAAAGRPLGWKVSITARDYDGKISELDIKADDSSPIRTLQ